MTTHPLASQPFDFGERLGLAFIVEGAILSVLAITTLLAYITYSAVTIRLGATRRWSTDTHIHYYFLNLMIFDLIQAIGGMFNITWIDAAGIYPGTICTTQGAFKQPLMSVCRNSTMAIAFHTMQVLVLKWKTPPRAALLGSVIIWVTVGLMVGIPNVIVDNFYGPTGHWCWIERNNFDRIGLQYLWMWVAAFLTVVVYIFLALVVKRIIIIDGYPAVYIITVLPITAARFTQFKTDNVPWAVTAWADTLLILSGFFNTILYTLTRPKLLPQRSRQSPSRVVRSPPSTSQQLGRMHRFHHYPIELKVEEGELPPMRFELAESQRSSSELCFVHPITSAEQ
ncbi:hypothetical protein AZE42_00100 [Rhizopogon vesiculosus]|uniref:Glucose receptor Git3 N-terminal domain-containing protein n=1 Tax=Rhizopogon vesiculosus TaxID=180088 RepID=A0A1J8Q8C0_9AGAM|nr:hypothetical protein AZE42_00100 [Rhizopogon vesiculosus]